MTTAFADDDRKFLQLPRQDIHIIKPSMKAWTESGDMVFAINAVGESIVFQLVDSTPKEPSQDVQEVEMDEEAYVQSLENAIVFLMQCQGMKTLEISLDDLNRMEGQEFSLEFDPDAGILRLALDTPLNTDNN